MKIRHAATLAVHEAILFWEKSRIPIKKEQHCIDKLEKLYKEWRNVGKRTSQECQSIKKREKKNMNQK